MTSSIRARVLAAAVVVAAAGSGGLLVAGQDSMSEDSPTVWTPGRITQVTLSVIESALLTLVLVYPGIMDPIVEFINNNIGRAGSRRRREVQSVVIEHAAALHNMLLDAIDQFEDMDATLSMLAE